MSVFLMCSNAADQNTDGGTLRRPLELVIDQCHIEVELASELRLKLSSLELSNEVTQLFEISFGNQS